MPIYDKDKTAAGYILILVLSVIGFLTLLLLLFSQTFLLQKKLEESLYAQTLARDYAKFGFQTALNLLQTTAGTDACMTCDGSLIKHQPPITHPWIAVIKPARSNSPIPITREDACFENGIYTQQFKSSARRTSGEAEERTHVRDEGFSPEAQQRGNLKCDAYVYLVSRNTSHSIKNQTDLLTIPPTLLPSTHPTINLSKTPIEKGFFAFYIQDLSLNPSLHTPSLAIPVNTLEGGLKTNLFLDKTLKGPIYNGLESPTWEYLYSFIHLIENNQGDPVRPIPTINAYYPSSYKLLENLATPSSYTIGPIIQGCQIGISLQTSSKRTTEGFTFIKVGLSIEVALVNPYDIPLETFPYIFEISTSDPQASLFLNEQSLPLVQKGETLFRGRIQTDFKPGELKIFKAVSGPLDVLKGNELQENATTPSGILFFEPPQYFAKNKDPSLERKSFFRLNLRLSPAHSNGTTFFQEIRDIKSTGLTKALFKWDSAHLNQPIFLTTIIPANKNYHLIAPLIEGTYTYNHKPEATYWLTHWNTDTQPLPTHPHLSRLYHLPKASEPLSLVSLRWANLTFLGDEPPFPFANSQLPLQIPSSAPTQKNARKGTHFQKESSTLYDHSYLMNTSLWDNVFFLKTNSPLTFIPSFNVNSTSPTAWTDLLRNIPSLSPLEKQRLAHAIVQEVKERGPFCSLSSFINRQLSPPQHLSSCGTLEAAIQKSGFQQKITQPELLEYIGSKLTVRSDTFRIITFGECPASPSSQSTHKIWCEAIVQRQFEFVQASANDPTDAFTSLSEINKNLGRRFKIKYFSWLEVK